MRKKAYVVVALLIAAAMLLSACGSSANQESHVTDEPIANSEPTVSVKKTALPGEWGAADKPIIFAFSPSSSPREISPGEQRLLDALESETGFVFKGLVPESSSASIEALGSGEVQISLLNTPAYIMAHEKGYVNVALIQVFNDSYLSGGQSFIANVSSGFSQATGSQTDPSILLQFKGKKACFTDPVSFMGYIIPLIFLKNAGLTDSDIPEPVFTSGISNTVQALYDGGVCDYGTMYYDVRSSIVNDHPDVKEKVVVIYQTDAIYPNDNISYAVDFPKDLQEIITNAMLSIAKDGQSNKLLEDLFGCQGCGIRQIDDTIYDQFREHLHNSDIDLLRFVR